MARASVLDVDYFDLCIEKIKRTRARLVSELNALGYILTDSDANFVFAKHPTMSGKEVQNALREKGVIVRRFDSPRIADYLRITIGTEEDTDSLVEILKTL